MGSHRVGILKPIGLGFGSSSQWDLGTPWDGIWEPIGTGSHWDGIWGTHQAMPRMWLWDSAWGPSRSSIRTHRGTTRRGFRRPPEHRLGAHQAMPEAPKPPRDVSQPHSSPARQGLTPPPPLPAVTSRRGRKGRGLAAVLPGAARAGGHHELVRAAGPFRGRSGAADGAEPRESPERFPGLLAGLRAALGRGGGFAFGLRWSRGLHCVWGGCGPYGGCGVGWAGVGLVGSERVWGERVVWGGLG